jgi:hypothetical protein
LLGACVILGSQKPVRIASISIEPRNQLPNRYLKHYNYKGADKSLARPGSKQATATEGFDIHISYL